MSLVEATSAERSASTSTARNSRPDTTPTDDASSWTQGFASIFALTRQSSAWMNDLFTRPVPQTGATERRQQQLAEVLGDRSRREPVATRTLENPDRPHVEPSARPQTDETRSSRNDRETTARRRQAAEPQRGASRESPRHAEGSSGHSGAAEPSRPQDASNEPTVTTAGPDDSARVQAKPTTANVAASQSANGSASATGQSTSRAVAGYHVPTGVSTPGTPVVSSEIVQMTQAVTANGSGAAGKGSGNGQGGAQDLGQSVSAKAAGGVGKPAAPTGDFQQTLHQVGRAANGRSTPGANTTSATTGMRSAEASTALNGKSIEDIAQIVRSQLTPRHSTMVLRLDPPELGQLRVNVQMHEQTLNIRFEAQTQVGHEALHSKVAELRHALEQAGVHFERVEIEFRPPGTQPDTAGENENHPHDQQQTEGHPMPFGQQAGGSDGEAESFDPSGFASGSGGEQAGDDLGTHVPRPEQPGEADLARPAETGVDVMA